MSTTESDKFLRYYDCCLECLTKDQRTEDHMVAKGMAKSHPEVLGTVAHNRRNLAPVCWPHHIRLERAKIKAYSIDGVSGLVIYLAESYPKSPDKEMLAVEKSQMGFIFREIAGNIKLLNGDAPRVFRPDYEKALDKSLYYADRFPD